MTLPRRVRALPLRLSTRAASPRHLATRACPAHPPIYPCVPFLTLPRRVRASPIHPATRAFPSRPHPAVCVTLASRPKGGVAPTHCSPLNELSFCAFERAVASCTPLVAKLPSSLSPLPSYAFHLASPLLPFASPLLPLASPLLPLTPFISPLPFLSREA